MRKEKNINKKKILTIYALGACSLAVLLSMGMIFYDFNKKTSTQIDVSKFEQSESRVDENGIDNNTIEQASSSIGKTVEESQEEQKVEKEMDNVTVKENSEATEKNQEKNKVVKSTQNTTTDKVAVNTSNVKIQNKEKREDNAIVETVAEPETEVKQESNDTKEELIFSMPVDGDIIKDFAKDTLVYSTTLNEWTTHTGVDIKAEKTTVVKAAEKGTVKYIKNDPRYGLTIVVEHDDGYSTVYSNLLTSEFFVEGEKVEKGQTLGTVGNTAAFEIADESHLHFEILKDNIPIDPNSCLR